MKSLLQVLFFDIFFSNFLSIPPLLAWDYSKGHVHLYMPGYVQKAQKKFQHIKKKKENQPFPYTPINYGAKTQHAKQASTAPMVRPAEKSSSNKFGEIFSSTSQDALLYLNNI